MQNNRNENTSIVILAAGKGTRMNSKISKVLMNLSGVPMINHLLESVKKISNTEPIIVVSKSNSEEIRTVTWKYNPILVIQDPQLGTADGVNTVLKNNLKLTENILVLYGDHPLISSQTIKKMITVNNSEKSLFTILVAQVPHFDGIYHNFYHDGRIIRNIHGEVEKIIEPNEATDQIMKMKEINPAIFLMNTTWLKKSIDKITINIEKNEYYLTSIIEIAQKEGMRIHAVEGTIGECWGANTFAQLENISEILKK